MIHRIFLSAIAISFVLYGFSQNVTYNANDGPYIFIENKKLVEKSVLDGKVITKALASDAYDTTFTVEPSSYTGVEKIAALSDIHGQYDLMKEILQNNEIIDGDGNWSFGNGHLVIVGDVFDRGPMVTEILWLIYDLEMQAKEAGGRVHYLLGNHEYMVLHKDLRYLNPRYHMISGLFDVGYDELYGPNTILGRWLRSKHTLLRINEHVFVHGGISQDFITRGGVDIEAINETMRTSIDRSMKEMNSTDFLNIYYGSSGPIWYRGYFYDPITEQAIDSILTDIQTEHIVVGHCSNKEVVSLYNKKVFGVDSSIQLGTYGEILLVLDGKYYRGKKDGKRVRLK